MTNTVPEIRGRGPSNNLRMAFVSSVVSLMAAFAAAGSAIPLFNLYRAQDGFTNADISMAIVSYSAATLTTLLVLGRLSSYLGRRPTSIAGLVLLLVGCLLLLDVHAVGILVLSRLLMGVGAGLASSSLSAYIIDTAPTQPPWLTPVASSQTVMLGLAVGTVTSGALVQFAPWPRQLIFLVVITLLLISVALLAFSPETVYRRPGAWQSLAPRVQVPTRIRSLVPVAAAVLLATWAAGAFYQAFVPALVENQLHTNSPLIVGVVFAAYMGSSVLGAPLNARFTAATAQRTSMIAFFAGMAGLVGAIATGSLMLFVVSTLVSGASQGVAISATTRSLLYGSHAADRAPTFSVIYLLSYSGATIPALIAGQLSEGMSLPQIAIGYSALAFAGATFTLFAARTSDVKLDPQHPLQ